jgi:hypothetical protein
MQFFTMVTTADIRLWTLVNVSLAHTLSMTRLTSCVNHTRIVVDVTLQVWVLLAFLSCDKVVRYQIRPMQVILNVPKQTLMSCCHNYSPHGYDIMWRTTHFPDATAACRQTSALRTEAGSYCETAITSCNTIRRNSGKDHKHVSL